MNDDISEFIRHWKEPGKHGEMDVWCRWRIESAVRICSVFWESRVWLILSGVADWDSLNMRIVRLKIIGCQLVEVWRWVGIYVKAEAGRIGFGLERALGSYVEVWRSLRYRKQSLSWWHLDGTEVSASGLKIRRSPVQVPPKTNFSILIKVSVKSTGE